MRSTPLFMASRACAAAVALCCAAAALGEAPAAGEKEVGNVVFKKDRIRRVIYNDDGDQQFKQIETRYGVTDEQSFIYARTTPTFDTQVDTYVWCVGNGAWPPWGGKEWTAHDFLGSSGRAADLIVEACHGKGIEVWASLRMNDLHDAGKKRLEDTWEPIKAQHPEYLIGKPEDRELPKERIERVLWTALNFERPEVRKYRLDFIKRNAAAHDFDGYELDFSRFIWTFPLGRERELAPLMTGFIREVRSALNEIGEKRGRPYTLVVHVVDSVETSLSLGQDVEAWLSEGLVDVLVVGMGFMPFSIQLDEWKALGERYGVPIYPSFNPRHLRRLFKYSGCSALTGGENGKPYQEYTRAVAAWWWHSGADGIYLFNVFTFEHEVGIDREVTHAPLKDVGDPALLAGKDKLYAIERLLEGDMFSLGMERAQLPTVLDIHERKLALSMGPDADDPTAQFKIHAWTKGGETDTKLWMRLNHRLLETVGKDGHYEVEVPKGTMRVGRNELSIWCNAELAKTSNPVIVYDKVLVEVNY